MTVTEPAVPDTALAILFGPDADAMHALVRLASDPSSLGGTLPDLPEATRKAAAHEVASAVSGLLNVSLIDVLVAGWRKYQDLVAAARRTLAAPGSVELVRLASHRVTATQEPYVTVMLDGHPVATLNLGLSVVLDVSALLAKITVGLLSELQSGRCDVTATLSVAGADFLTRQGHLELPGVVALGHGIRLLPADDYRAKEDSSEAAKGHRPGADSDRGSHSVFFLELAAPPLGRVWALNRGRLTIGRDPSSDICLDDPGVSRHHADLVGQGSDWMIIDAGSANGTSVNGARVNRIALQPGDVIGLSDVQLVLKRAASS